MIAPQSAVSGIVWPALSSGTPTARMLALQQQLGETQRLAPDALLRRQFLQLGQLLDHAYREIPFYRQRLEAAGYAPGTRLTPEIWARIPSLTRKDVQALGEALRSGRPPRDHGSASKSITSGSTGRPLEAYVSKIAQFFWAAFTLRNHLWHGRNLGGRLAAIRAVGGTEVSGPDGKMQDNWGFSTAMVTATGPASVLDIGYSAEHQARWLQSQNPDYLLTHPSNLLQLANYCRENGIEMPKLRDVMTVSEVLDPEAREACREAWGVEVVDLYTTQEHGYLAIQCPRGEHYHVQSEGVLLEVLDGERPCGPGEVGRVVATRLHNFAMPLIRNEIGDYAEVGEPCGCGRRLPVLKRIMGRARNLVTLPTGERHWPLVGGRSMTAVAPIRQFQLVQTSLEHIEVRLVVLRQVTREEEEKLRELLQNRLGHPFALTFTYHDEIPRGPGGKFEDFRSEIPRETAQT